MGDMPMRLRKVTDLIVNGSKRWGIPYEIGLRRLFQALLIFITVVDFIFEIIVLIARVSL